MSSDLRTPAGLLWACRGCADCCSTGLELGPVEPHVVEGLEEADIASLWPPAAEAPWVERQRAEDGSELLFFTQRGGRCVFLRDDDLCAVHAQLGPAAKPGFCREFPYHLVDDPKGTVAVVRPSCGGFHRSFRDGDPVGPELEAVRALPRVHPRRVFAPGSVRALPGVEVELDTWMRWEAAALEALEAQVVAPGTGVAIVRDTLYAAAGRDAPEPRDAQLRAALGATLYALEAVMRRVLAQDPNPADATRAAFATEMTKRLEAVRARVMDERPLLDPAATAYVHLLLRSHLAAKQWEAWGGVPQGLGLWLIGVYAAVLDARAPLDPEAFTEAYQRWLRFHANRLIQAVLRKAEPALVDAFLHAT